MVLNPPNPKLVLDEQNGDRMIDFIVCLGKRFAVGLLVRLASAFKALSQPPES